MHSVCIHTERMSKLLQIRNVPDAVHRKLKSRAAILGMSLSDYLLLEIRVVADRPSVQAWRDRLAQRAAATQSVDPSATLRRERDHR